MKNTIKHDCLKYDLRELVFHHAKAIFEELRATYSKQELSDSDLFDDVTESLAQARSDWINSYMEILYGKEPIGTDSASETE